MISSNRTPKIHFTICVVLVVCSSLVSGCERQEERTKTAQLGLVESVEATKPMLLVGDYGDSARYALIDYIAQAPPYVEGIISTRANGTRIVRTDLGFGYVRNATVGEVNTLLASIDASIVAMAPGVDILAIEIPDPGDLEAYDEIIQQLENSPVVRFVTQGVVPESR